MLTQRRAPPGLRRSRRRPGARPSPPGRPAGDWPWPGQIARHPILALAAAPQMSDI